MDCYQITPIPKPRMTKSDKWKKRPCVTKYWAFKDEVRKNKVTYKNGQSITYIVPMPKSWSRKRRLEMDGKPHTQTPDIDNLNKALFDAIFDNDAHIWHIGEQKKNWGETGKIIVD